jgi:serine/threonine protein kinase
MNPSLYLDLPSKKITCMKTMSHGSFGYIDLALEKTTEGTNEVYVKRPILPGKSLLYEACIQKWVAEELSTIGFSTGAPQITHIFMLRDHSICFSMKPIEGAMTLDRYLESVSTAHLSNVIIDCLFQLCGMLWHLNHVIGMNHRDIKPSNFLIVVKEQPETKIIVVEHELIELQSSHSLTLIDFGFSCIGSIETQHTELSLSTVYPKDDPCPKEGRDLYLFLGLLYIDYYHQLAPRLRILFESWLQEPGSRLCAFMRKDKEHSKKWLYFMAGNEQIKRFHSTPQRIVCDLQAFR